MKVINKNDKLYYARIIPNAGIYDVCDLTVRTVEDDYFVGIDKRDKHAYLFGYDSIDEVIFSERKIAVEKIRKAEMNKKEISSDTYYEEY